MLFTEKIYPLTPFEQKLEPSCFKILMIKIRQHTDLMPTGMGSFLSQIRQLIAICAALQEDMDEKEKLRKEKARLELNEKEKARVNEFVPPWKQRQQQHAPRTSGDPFLRPLSATAVVFRV